MRYTVKTYLCTNFAGLMDELETDSFDEVQEFILANAQKGYNCVLIDNEMQETRMYYADCFGEETLSYAELLMEQQEQM